MSRLVPYSDSSASSDSDHDDERPSPTTAPQLPIEFAPAVDFSIDERGQIRSVPHVRGNWASHVYIEVKCNDQIRRFMETCHQETIRSHPNVRWIGEGLPAVLHISLSRTLYLREFQISPFLEQISRGLNAKKGFEIVLGGLSAFTNDEQTRSFLAVDVQIGIQDLKWIVDVVDSVCLSFHQLIFYEDPKFHASFLWAPPDGQELSKELADRLKHSISLPCAMKQHVKNVKCKFRHIIHTIDFG